MDADRRGYELQRWEMPWDRFPVGRKLCLSDLQVGKEATSERGEDSLEKLWLLCY